VQSIQVFLQWRQQDGAHDEGDEQSSDSLTDVLLVASPAQGELASSTRNQEEQRYPPRVDQEQYGHNSFAFFRVFDVPGQIWNKGMQSVIEEDSQYEDYAQPIEIV
jgi:hypothetical protein